jgi:hypothetical protein
LKRQLPTLNIIVAFNYLLANPMAPNFATTANTLFSKRLDRYQRLNQPARRYPCKSFTLCSCLRSVCSLAPETNACNFIGRVRRLLNKAAFISSSSKQPPLYLETRDWFNSCTQVAWLWISVSGNSNNAEKVRVSMFSISMS